MAGLAGLRSKEEVLNDLNQMIEHDIRINSQLATWLEQELEKAGVI